MLIFDNNSKGEGFRVSHCGSKISNQNVCINGKPLTGFLLQKFGYNPSEKNRVILSCHVKKHVDGDFLALEINKG